MQRTHTVVHEDFTSGLLPMRSRTKAPPAEAKGVCLGWSDIADPQIRSDQKYGAQQQCAGFLRLRLEVLSDDGCPSDCVDLCHLRVGQAVIHSVGNRRRVRETRTDGKVLTWLQ